MTVDWTSWRKHFEGNAERRLPATPSDPGPVPAGWIPELASSLARFQAGETSEGRLAWQIERVDWPTIDDDYRGALKLFVREEARHARILGGWVRALGGPPPPMDHWSKRSFTFARRLAGVRAKLLVALAAEVVGIGFYGLLAEKLPPGPLQASMAELCGDEEHHLAFHGDFFRRSATSGARRALFRATYWPIGLTAAALCVLDHRRTLALLDVSPRQATARMVRLLARVDREVTSAQGEATPQPARRLA
jgi:hypothetical protein